MADQRVFFAGDLGTQHLNRHVEVQSPDVEVAGKLQRVDHLVSCVTKRPVTYVLLDEAPEAKGYTLDPNWKVVVSPPTAVAPRTRDGRSA